MSLIHRLVIVVVALLLTTSLVAANGVLLVQRTAADDGFVTNALDEADAYEALHAEFLESDAFAMDEAQDGFGDEALLMQLVTPEYLQDQVEANVERTYAYLHGDRDDLVLEFDLRPIKERAPDVIAAHVESMDLSELVDRAGPTDPSADVPLENTSLTTEQLFAMGDNRSQYEAVREQFRADLREDVIEQAAEEVFAEATNDELLALVIEDYDPDEYTEAEKEEMVDDRESEIMDGIATEIREERGDEIDERIDERLAEIVEEARDGDGADGGGPDGGGPDEDGADEDDPVAAAAASLYRTHVVGLAGEQSFEEFRTALDDDMAAFASAVGEQVAAEIDDELPDRFDLTDEMDDDVVEAFESARQAFAVLGTLVIVLPLLATVFAGLLWWVSATGLQAAWWGGIATTVSGLPWLAGLWLAGRQLEGVVESVREDAELLGVILDALLQGTLAVGMSQSLVLTAAGGILLGGVLAFRYDVGGAFDR